jgi:DNA-binding CsgD family transcriptional regulator
MSEALRALSAVGRVGAIAGSRASLKDRADEVVGALAEIVPLVAAEIVAVSPLDGSSEVLASTGYSDHVLDSLHSPAFHRIMTELNLPGTGRPIRMKDLPGDPLDNWAVAEVLLPAGYREGMTMCLRTPDGRFTGVLNLSTDTSEHPSDLARDAIASLCGALGNLADPTRRQSWLRLLLGAGTAAVGLNGHGGIIDLPGLDRHGLLTEQSELVRVARTSAGRRGWSSFVWPDGESWLRVRVFPCRGEGDMVKVVSLDPIDVSPLSRRELEVLTLATEGLSNHEIGEALIIGDRTVATHVEHILAKLDAPNRAAAAVHAMREGLVLGRVECPGRRVT